MPKPQVKIAIGCFISGIIVGLLLYQFVAPAKMPAYEIGCVAQHFINEVESWK
jgi:hypothetical protein